MNPNLGRQWGRGEDHGYDEVSTSEIVRRSDLTGGYLPARYRIYPHDVPSREWTTDDTKKINTSLFVGDN